MLEDSAVSIAPRRSVTNEAALQPHENAFRSSAWSVPDGVEVMAQPMSGFMGGVPVAAPTERHDTMEAHMPSSFRVYTPDETRDAPMRRRSFHSIEVEPGSDTVGARTLLKWTGIGIVAGLCVLTVLIFALGSTGDDGKRVASNSARASIGKLSEQPAAAAPVVAAPVTPAAVEKPAEIEVGHDAPQTPPKKATTITKKPTTKKKG